MKPPLRDNPPRDPASRTRLSLAIVALVLLWPALQVSEFNLAALLDPANIHTMGSFLSGFWPPTGDPVFVALLARATVETLAMATAGMTLALALALPCSLVATRALSRARLLPNAEPGSLGLVLRWPTRSLLIVLRSVPEIVWALLFVRAVGLGPTAGVLAIAITYAGMLGKVYAEIYESVDLRPAQALVQAGSSRPLAFCYGLLPNALGEMLSYTIYRWECAIRASLIMGFVGAGGLGQQLDLSLRMFAGGEVAAILLVFLALVMLSDQLSAGLRRLLV
jgi:phosphonate transport system permease protein